MDFEVHSTTPPPPVTPSGGLQSDGSSSLSIREKVVLEQGDIRSSNYVAGSQGWRITNDTAEFNFSISSGAIDIGGADATSFHVDTDGNMWMGASSYASAPFKVSNAGVLTLTSATTGENINITSTKFSVRNDTNETGYLRGYQTTDRYGDTLNASELFVNDVKATRLHHAGMIILDGGGGGTIDAAWLWGTTDFSATDRAVAIIGTTVYISGDTTGATAGVLDLGATASDLRIRTTAGAPTGGVSGSVALDTTNSRLYAKVGSTWKYAALT